MSETSKPLYESPLEQINKIDEIVKHEITIVENALSVQNKYDALYKILNLSKNIWENYDIKVAISPSKWYYFLQINWHKLNIEIKSLDELDKILNSIEKSIKISLVGPVEEVVWLWDNKIYLNWDLTSRKIKINDSILPAPFDSEIINSNNTLSKNEIEEIFVFIMKVKWIQKEDWDIKSTICRKNIITDECKNKLWFQNAEQ